MTPNTPRENGESDRTAESLSERVASALDTRRSFVKRGAATTTALGLGLGATGGAAADDDEDETDTDTPEETDTPEDGDDDDDDDEEETATVQFENQTTDGSSVTVASVTVPDGGFVAIHDASLLEGEVIPSVIGVSESLEAGEHEDVDVELFDVMGADFETDALEETQPLIPMPHRDTNGNEEYDFVATEGEEDGPYVDDEQPVVGLGFAVVESSDH